MSLMVRHIRERLQLSGVRFQTIGHLKCESIWIFAAKEHWDEIFLLLHEEERKIIYFADSSVKGV